MAMEQLRSATSATVSAPTDSVERSLWTGVSLRRPFSITSTLITNAHEMITGERDERVGKAGNQIGLAGMLGIQTLLRAEAAQGIGILAKGARIGQYALPAITVGTGLWAAYRGASELEPFDSPLDVFASRSARTGLLEAATGVLLMRPGIASGVLGTTLRTTAAANELDAFSVLDPRGRVAT